VLLKRDEKICVSGEKPNRDIRDCLIEEFADTSRTGGGGGYIDIPGFCKSVNLDEIRINKYIITPGRYVGLEKEEQDDTPFIERIETVRNELETHFKKGAELSETIRKKLAEVASNV